MSRETSSEEYTEVTVRVPASPLRRGIVTAEGIERAAQDYVDAAVDAYLLDKAAKHGVRLNRVTGVQFGDGNNQVNNFPD